MIKYFKEVILVAIEKEEDMHIPLKKYFEDLGYEIQSEVKDCDFVAQKNDELILIELKMKFCLKLIYQAMERQKISEDVYIAIPMPKGGSFKKAWHQMSNLIRSLSIGLITVNNKGEVKIHSYPEEYNRRKNYNKKKIFLKELNSRQTNINKAGKKGKVMTVYREQSIIVAYALFENGEMKRKKLIEHLNFQKAGDILYQNHYDWFFRVSKGIYDLTETGKEAILKYEFAQELYENWMNKKTDF